MSDRLFAKFTVARTDGRDQPGGDKASARYFVLDYVHDPYAREALQAYIDACRDGIPGLAADLERALRVTRPVEGGSAVLRDGQRPEGA